MHLCLFNVDGNKLLEGKDMYSQCLAHGAHNVCGGSMNASSPLRPHLSPPSNQALWGGSDKLIPTRTQMIDLVECIDLSRALCFLIAKSLKPNKRLLNAEQSRRGKIWGKLGISSWKIILYGWTSAPWLCGAKQRLRNEDRAQHFPFISSEKENTCKVSKEYCIFSSLTPTNSTPHF